MCPCSVGRDDVPNAEVSIHFVPLGSKIPIHNGRRCAVPRRLGRLNVRHLRGTRRGSISYQRRSIWKTPYLRVGKILQLAIQAGLFVFETRRARNRLANCFAGQSRNVEGDGQDRRRCRLGKRRVFYLSRVRLRHKFKVIT